MTVRELFKPAEFGPRFSSGARAQSFSKGRIKVNIPLINGCWLVILSTLIADLLHVLFQVNSCEVICIKACGFDFLWIISWLAFCSLFWWRVNRIFYLLCWNVIVCSLFHDASRSWESSACYQAQQRWEINLCSLKKLQNFVLKSATSGSVSNHRRVINSLDYQAQKLFRMPSWSGLLPRQVYQVYQHCTLVFKLGYNINNCKRDSAQ